MKRPKSICLSAILVLVGSLIWLSLNLSFIAVALNGEPHMSPFSFMTETILFGFLASLSLLGIATCIGLLLFKQWARISILWFAGFLVLFGTLMTAFYVCLIIWPSNKTPWMSDESPPSVISNMFMLLLLFLPMTFLGTWWLRLFNKPSVKELFAG